MSSMWKAMVLIGMVLLALSACYLAGDSNTRSASSPSSTKLQTEDELVMAEDFGLGIRLWTPEDEVISRLGKPKWIRDGKFARSLIYGSATSGNREAGPLAIDIRKPSEVTYGVIVFDVQDDWVKERMSLFGKPVHEITLEYLQSVLPTGEVKAGPAKAIPFEGEMFSWVSALDLQTPGGDPSHKLRLVALFKTDGVLEMIGIVASS